MVLGSTDYNKKWNNDYTSKDGIRDKLREAAHSQTPLKPRIEEAQKKLQIQIAKLDEMSSKMQRKDKANLLKDDQTKGVRMRLHLSYYF